MKNIHIVLIAISLCLAVAFGFWALAQAMLLMGILSFICAVGLIAYGIHFLQKSGKSA